MIVAVHNLCIVGENVCFWSIVGVGSAVQRRGRAQPRVISILLLFHPTPTPVLRQPHRPGSTGNCEKEAHAVRLVFYLFLNQDVYSATNSRTGVRRGGRGREYGQIKYKGDLAKPKSPDVGGWGKDTPFLGGGELGCGLHTTRGQLVG